MTDTEPHALGPEDLAAMAEAAGLLPPGAALTPALLEYTEMLVRHCATLAGGYGHHDDNPHDAILAGFGLH
jgi:hypothetical protein